MTSQLSIYNEALILCSERSLASLTENREPRRVLDTVWNDDFLKGCLEVADWNFAIRSVELTFDPDFSPSFGYQYAFDKPSDWRRTSAVCRDAQFDIPLNKYVDEGGYWYADPGTIYIRYVSDDPSYGMDMTKWPMNFTRWVEAHLAMRIYKRLANASADEQVLIKKEADALGKAKSFDAMQQPTEFPPPGRWVNARMRGWGRTAR